MKHRAILLLLLVLAACDVTPELPAKTVIVTPTPQPTPAHTPSPTATPLPPSPTPTPAPRALNVCMGAEPASLYLYDDHSYAAQLIREAIYDGPIDTVGYTSRPVILQKLPSLADGDAVITTIDAGAGTRVIDANGDVATLAPGVRVRPSGCRADDCAVTFDEDPVPMDQLRSTFTLIPGLHWSDGQPLTAQDSVYSFDLARNPQTATGKWLELRTASYVAADDQTAVWTGIPGFLDPAYTTAFWTPLPQHVWAAYTVTDLPTQDAVTRTPLGYGAYVIDEWIPGKHVRLSPNPYYFRTAEGLPAFDVLTFRFLPHNAGQALDALENGRCDILTTEFYLVEELERLKTMAADGELLAYAAPTTRWAHLTFNVDPPPGYDHPAFFRDVHTRQAIAYCIDRQAIVDANPHITDIALDSYVPSDHPLYATGAITRYTYNPAQGQALLDAAGWRDADGDGVREAHNVPGLFDGTPFRVVYTTSQAESRQVISAAIAEDLAACGIQVDVEVLDSGTLFAEGGGTPVFGRHFDLVQLAWLTDVIPPCDLYLSTEVSSEDNQWNGQNFSGYADPAYDAVCVRALNTLPGEPGFEAAHIAAQQRFSAALPELPLFRYVRYLATRPDLEGFIPDAIAVETWHIEAFALK